MTEEQKTLWTKIHNFEIDDIDSDFTFTDRLVRENGWSYEYSIRSIEEYKKFIFLICISTQPLTPSDQIDQIWHLHLIYTHSYWIELCKNTIHHDIHHWPTKGGKEDRIKYWDQYEETKKFYQFIFEKEPPSDIWPSSKVRFRYLRYTRVNKHRNWIIPKFFINK